MDISGISASAVKIAVCTKNVSDPSSSPLTHGYGSGFFVKRKQKTYLITNFHVVYGIDHITGCDLRQNTACDIDLLELYFYKYIKDNEVQRDIIRLDLSVDKSRIKTYSKSKELIVNNNKMKLPEVDIVAIDVTNELTNCRVLYIEDYVNDHAMSASIGIDSRICVVGFPFGDKDSTGLPIFKYSFIASEPNIDQIDPYFYIDTNSVHGMSGGLVFYKEKLNIVNLTFDHKATVKYESKLVGVYAGRCSNEENDITSHLGRVWRYELIDNVIDGTQYKKTKSSITSKFVYNIVKETDDVENGILAFSPIKDDDVFP
ncbi:MAG: hypothetical protein SPK65_01885 [Succinivibrio dextrinosolvens]|nr:hypothetical protein [Succinivibrio dextrinosolvens]